MRCCMTRRKALSLLGAGATGTLMRPLQVRAEDLPISPVAVAKCSSYGSEVLPALSTMFDQLGGLGKLVAGKTVAVKVNLVSSPLTRLGDYPPERTHWTHPSVIGATVHLLGRAGARRIKVLECCGESIDSFADHIKDAGWNPNDILNAADNVEMENTNGPGSGKYSRIWCAKGGLVFPGYDINQSYTDCDVLVSIPKMKEHHWFGVTLSIKNCYGMTPLNIYGTKAGIDEPSVEVDGNRVQVFHTGERAPSKSAPQELDPASPRAGDYRIPRIITEIVSGRPIHLAVIDGIEGLAGGEGPWYPNVSHVSPGVLVAGFNPVSTDSVCMALMGFDPKAQRGTPPFDDSDNFLDFAEYFEIGSRDLSRIEVLGTPIAEARYPFRPAATDL